MAGGDLTLKSGISTGTGSSAIHFFTASAGSTGTADNAPTEKVTILNNGNVGIGTTGPGAKLHVDSGATANVARFYSSNNAPEIFVGQALVANQATALGYNVSGGYTFLQTYGDPWGLLSLKTAATSASGRLSRNKN